MLRRLMFICLLMLASVLAAPGAMAHGAHDHGKQAQAQPVASQEQAATAQPACMTCNRDDAHHHESDCCSFGCHLLSLPTQATLSLRDTLQAAPPVTQGRAAHGLNPSGLERPPRA